MTNQALPQKSRQMIETHLDKCRNLGLILDKFAPWAEQGTTWDLVMRSTVRQRGQNEIKNLSGGEAKGIWLHTSRRAKQGESPSLFEVARTDVDLMAAVQDRWLAMVRGSGGVAFTMLTAERLVAGLGAAHVLETALTLDRNTGLPYLPGSSVKGLARAWGLIEVAFQLGITLEATVKERNGEETSLLNKVSEILISKPDEKKHEKDTTWKEAFEELPLVSERITEAEAYIQWFRFIFGTQFNAAAVCFLDAVYAGDDAPLYAADVMTPHYVNYYTDKGSKPPAEDDNPNPVSFITVDVGNLFAFGLAPRMPAFGALQTEESRARLATALETAVDWLSKGLSQMGIGGKTAAGYGFFNRRSYKMVVERP